MGWGGGAKATLLDLSKSVAELVWSLSRLLRQLSRPSKSQGGGGPPKCIAPPAPPTVLETLDICSAKILKRSVSRSMIPDTFSSGKWRVLASGSGVASARMLNNVPIFTQICPFSEGATRLASWEPVLLFEQGPS